MKKLFRPFLKMASNYYEETTLTQVPRSRTRKIRKYAHVDIQKDFEKKQLKFEKYKRELLGEAYKLNDKQIAEPGSNFEDKMVVPQNVDLLEIGEPDDIKGKYIVSGARKL